MPATRKHPATPLDDALSKDGRTNEWLARQLNVNVTQVSRWRRGVNIPTGANRRRIAKALGVSVESLWPSEGS